MASRPLTWQNVQAPDYRGVTDNTRLAFDLFQRAGDTASQGIQDFGNSRIAEAGALYNRNIANGIDPNTGVNLNLLRTPDIVTGSNLATARLNQAGQQQKNIQDLAMGPLLVTEQSQKNVQDLAMGPLLQAQSRASTNSSNASAAFSAGSNARANALQPFAVDQAQLKLNDGLDARNQLALVNFRGNKAYVDGQVALSELSKLQSVFGDNTDDKLDYLESVPDTKISAAQKATIRSQLLSGVGSAPGTARLAAAAGGAPVRGAQPTIAETPVTINADGTPSDISKLVADQGRRATDALTANAQAYPGVKTLSDAFTLLTKPGAIYQPSKDGSTVLPAQLNLTLNKIMRLTGADIGTATAMLERHFTPEQNSRLNPGSNFYNGKLEVINQTLFDREVADYKQGLTTDRKVTAAAATELASKLVAAQAAKQKAVLDHASVVSRATRNETALNIPVSQNPAVIKSQGKLDRANRAVDALSSVADANRSIRAPVPGQEEKKDNNENAPATEILSQTTNPSPQERVDAAVALRNKILEQRELARQAEIARNKLEDEQDAAAKQRFR